MITPADVQAAHHRLRAHVRRTPVLELAPGAFGLAVPLSLKLELHQHGGSFKARGAFNRVLTGPVPPAGLIAASGGNHGVAVAHVGRELSLPTEIFVPEIAAPAKVERIRALGAAVTVAGRTYAEALEASARRAAGTGALVVHAYDQPEVLAGQGTVALEWEADAPPLDALLVAVGGGGLLGGMAAWLAGRVRVVAVEPEGCPTLARALEAGRPVDVEVGGIAADSLGARRLGAGCFEVASAQRSAGTLEHVLVSDDAIRLAWRALWRELRVAAEPGAAAALAALLSGAWRPRPGERVGVLVCGGNVDPAHLAG
jgi:threonine dehydratase